MKTTLSPTHHGLPINTNEERGMACQETILDKYHETLNHMLEAHNKVMQVRFDLHYPQDNSIAPSNDHIHSFNYNLKRSLNREHVAGGHQTDPHLVWVREQHDGHLPHFHHVLLVNGNAKQHYYPLVRRAEKLWRQAIGTEQAGLVDFCDDHGANGMMIRKGSDHAQDQLEQCFYQASYLAKERGKETKGKGAWAVGGSRIPRHDQTDTVTIYP
ncbi:MAG: inovirus Gp2 family protein [Clostridiales bacterium]|jgi:hypothetical protein|nr:inovirus Gp2 family protein [Clostridiales bacterium]